MKRNINFLMKSKDVHKIFYILLCCGAILNCQSAENEVDNEVAKNKDKDIMNLKNESQAHLQKERSFVSKENSAIYTKTILVDTSLKINLEDTFKLPGNKKQRKFKKKSGFNEQNCAEDRSVIVHLFNWKWTDIEKECVRFLGPMGYCGVQVSPPNEHKMEVTESVNHPWWERYQPVSYKLGSRSGSPKEFANMVKTCNKVNVRFSTSDLHCFPMSLAVFDWAKKVYVDIVINHMMGVDGTAGMGSWGSRYDTRNLSFPGVPYNSSDFHCCYCDECTKCGIEDYGDVKQVRNCRLLGLADLNLSKQDVRNKISTFLNHLITLGVAGFRVDGAKHMWPDNLKLVYTGLRALRRKYFGRKASPFIYNEVIDQGNEPIHGSEYYNIGLGRVTEFKFGNHIAKAFRGYFPLAHLKSFGEIWQMYPTQYSLVFVDNHDNQRDHGGGGSIILTFYEPRLYKLATAFALAWPYGAVRIMSSYRWGWERMGNTDLGPPTNNGSDIKSVVIEADGGCDNGGPHTWICEHRWRQISHMVQWRNVAGGQEWNIENWWDNSGNQIAFSRGDKAFLAINNDKNMTMSESLYTGLSSGLYCDIISGHVTKDGTSCTGKEILVDSNSKAQIEISPSDEDPMVAIHVGSKIQDSSEQPQPLSTPRQLTRTVIFIKYDADPETDVFIRGGISHHRRQGCTGDATTSACSIRIDHNKVQHKTKWHRKDKHLDWYGGEIGQENKQGVQAQGTPMIWTSNDKTRAKYHPLNKYGQAYWMADVKMNCRQSENGWFEFKLFSTHNPQNNGWEGDVDQKVCTDSRGEPAIPVAYPTQNHLARCGYINVFKFNSGDCYSVPF